MEFGKGVFIVESFNVISRVLDVGYEFFVFMCECKYIFGSVVYIIKCCGDVFVYMGDRELLIMLIGYVLICGVLCVMCCLVLFFMEEICWDIWWIVVIDGVVDIINIGVIFCLVVVFGIDVVLLICNFCDLLNCCVVRVFMGLVFLVLWIWLNGMIGDLNKFGFCIVVMVLIDDFIFIDYFILVVEFWLVIVMGIEGDGFFYKIIVEVDYVVCIFMVYGVDLFNVVVVVVVVFW